MERPREMGPLGRPRGVAFGIVLFIVTLGLYGWYWAFQTHEELKQHTGEGLGGVLGLVVWIFAAFVSAFAIPSEVAKMYAKAGREPPVTGWTGLWLVPGFVLIVPAIVWFVRVQRALNDYWSERAPAAALAPVLP
jgi:hypothetical protein